MPGRCFLILAARKGQKTPSGKASAGHLLCTTDRYWGTSQGARVDWTAINRSLILLGFTQDSVYKQDKARRSRGLPGSGRKSRVQGAKAGRSTGAQTPPRPGPRPERASVSPPPPARGRESTSSTAPDPGGSAAPLGTDTNSSRRSCPASCLGN